MLSLQGQTTSQVFKTLRQTHFVIFFLWIALTALNLTKAFHIDDTFHLEAAQWISEHPGRPMSGFINWDQAPEPIYTFNQPPLFFAFLAAIISIFGASALVLHLFLSVFTFLSLYLFYKLAQLFAVNNINRLLLFFAFCPALIINQNLMTDVPLLCFELGFVYFMLKAKGGHQTKNYAVAGLLLGLGLLIKYSLLPLLVVMPVSMIIRKHYKSLVYVFIPLVILVAWSFWNHEEYGAVHLLNRERHPIQFVRILDFLNCLGAVTVLSIPFAHGLYPSKIIRWCVYSVCSLFLLSFLVVAAGWVSETVYTNYLMPAFTINGVLTALALLAYLTLTVKKTGISGFTGSDDFFMLLICMAMSGFLALLAPFVATRHVLLVLPFILILGRGLFDTAGALMNRLAVTITMALGLTLALSDWKFADYYRTQAANLPLPKDKTIWFAGHWGWQWYAKQNGLREYDPLQSAIKNDDYLVYPGKISRQAIHHTIQLVDKVWQPAGPATFFSVSHAGLYSSAVNFPVWCLSQHPIDTLFIYKVTIADSPE